MEFSLPLPLYSAIPIGSLKGRDGDDFSIFAGLDTDMVRQLKEKSLDASDVDIQENTSDRKRFGEGSYEEWYAQDRVPFALVETSSGALAGIVWFGPKALGAKPMKHLSKDEQQQVRAQAAGDWHTLAYRAYPPFRGKGVMKKFVTEAIALYESHFPNMKLWAIIDARNEASRVLSEKLGFVPLEGKSDDSSVVMIKER